MTELQLFEATLEQSPSERVAFLEKACAGNQPLRERLEALLARHLRAANFLKAPAADMNAASDILAEQRPGTVIAGRYKLLEQIGAGGMGSVWVAEQTEPVKRRVALKLIKPGMDSRQVLSRFEAERQALALMGHPNIARVFDGGLTDQGRPFFVMEYVKGVPITEYCDNARLSIQERLKLFVPICQAVQHAHQKGIIHRDLKPSNILVAEQDDQPVPKVIDFGLAKAMHQPLTEHTLYTAHGMMVGTPIYMSPEQAEVNNLDVDTRTDIYSLGVILYELLTGTTPVEMQSLRDAAWQEILRLIKEVEPLKPSLKLSASASLPSVAAQRSLEPAQLRRTVQGDLDWIVMKSLEKERSRRYATANGLARDVERYLSDEPVEACPPSASYRLKRFLRRNKGPVLAAAALIPTLVGGIVGTTWGLIRAKESWHAEAQQRKLAETARELADQRADVTLRTVKVVFTQIQNRIGKTPGLQPLKQDLVRTAAESLKDLPQMTGRSGITTAATTLAFHDLMHRMYLETGQTDKAWTHIVQAHDIARQRVEAQNQSTASRLNLAAVCRDMAEMRRNYNRDMQVALTYAREALALYEGILASPRPQAGDPPRLQVLLLEEQVHSSLASIFVRLGDPAQALAHFQQAQAVLAGIQSDPEYVKLPEARRKQNEAGFREESAAVLAGMGEMHFRLGQPDQARAKYLEAVASREETFQQHAADLLAKQRLAAMLSQAGNLYMLAGEPEKAAAHFDRAIQLSGELVEADKQIVDYKQVLALAHFRRGVLRQMQNDPAARQSFEACRAIRAELAMDATNADRQRELLLVLPHCGRHREAAELADKLLAANAEPDVELLLDLARAYAQCSLAAGDDPGAADAYRAQAFERLGQAVKAGHRDPVYLEHEPDFTPLRSGDNFRGLIQQERQAASGSVGNTVATPR